jgi:hypothetical protein
VQQVGRTSSAQSANLNTLVTGSGLHVTNTVGLVVLRAGERLPGEKPRGDREGTGFQYPVPEKFFRIGQGIETNTRRAQEPDGMLRPAAAKQACHPCARKSV